MKGLALVFSLTIASSMALEHATVNLAKDDIVQYFSSGGAMKIVRLSNKIIIK